VERLASPQPSERASVWRGYFMKNSKSFGVFRV
jgi:hypothetical protein